MKLTRDAQPEHDFTEPLYSQATVDTLRDQLEAAGYEERRILDQRNGAREQVTKLHQTLEAMQARAEAAEAECARLREDASRTIASLWDGHMRAEGILGPHSENQVVEDALSIISDCANQSFRWPESLRENIELAYEQIDAARTKEETK